MPQSVSVVICAYTQDRWELLCAAVASVLDQTVPPHEVLVCVDHNPQLASAATEHFATEHGPRVQVLENHLPGRLGSARNSAVARASGQILAFLDDDAAAPRDWLQKLLEGYEAHPEVMTLGGAPLPRYAAPRPTWIPEEFNWVFGCAYKGMPVTRSPIPHLIGANMSARRRAVLQVGGFHSDNHDDMDLCHRVAHAFGADSVVYDPNIQVSHFVSQERLTWGYFWRRCYHVNRGKVVAFADMAEAGNLRAEISFALRMLLIEAPRKAMRSRDGFRQALAAVAGVALAGLGHIVGRVELSRGTAPPSLTLGLPQDVVDAGLASLADEAGRASA